jgi:RNA polymerase primary sigma factor
VRSRLVEAHLHQVVLVARRYDVGLLRFSDLIQEGSEALLRAVDRFDPRRGVRLGTYAHRWISNTMRQALAHQGRIVRVPASVIDAHYRLRRAREEFELRHGYSPSPSALAGMLGVPVGEVERMLDTPLVDKTAQTGSSRDSQLQPVERLEDREIRRADDEAFLRSWIERGESILAWLNGFERLVLEHRFGLGGKEELSFREIGERRSISGERVRQIQTRALAKLLVALES